jgi:hypothetical protein
VPSWVKVVVLSSELQPGALTRGNSLLLVPVTRAIDSQSLAKREEGSIQMVGDSVMVLSPRRGYIGFVGTEIIGISATMPRQDFVRRLRWARKPDKEVISTYLNEAVTA